MIIINSEKNSEKSEFVKRVKEEIFLLIVNTLIFSLVLRDTVD